MHFGVAESLDPVPGNTGQKSAKTGKSVIDKLKKNRILGRGAQRQEMPVHRRAQSYTCNRTHSHILLRETILTQHIQYVL